MLFKRLFILVVSGIILTGLMAACGDETVNPSPDSGVVYGSSTNPASPAGTVSLATRKAGEPVSADPTGQANPVTTTTPAAPATESVPATPKSKPTKTTTSPPASPLPSKAPRSGSVSAAEPCKLFTDSDFVSVFGKTAGSPDQENFPEWSSCDYEFNDPAIQGPDTGYGLEVRLLKGEFSNQKFEDSYEALKPQLQKVNGSGDSAYFLPSATADSTAALFVLKGPTSFILNLLEAISKV